MKTRFMSLVAYAAVVSAILSAPGAARADSVTLASNNATIQPGGPRPGANGKAFFNMEGSSNGTFASFGVVDFQTGSGATFGAGDVLSITLAQANASFTHDGLLAFYLTTDTTTDIEPGTSPLFYNAADPPTGLGSQLGTRYLLGLAMFTEVADGYLDIFSFTPSGAALSYLTNEFNMAGKVRIIIAPDDASVAATYAGFSNTDFQGPTLAVVPEPSTFILEASGLLFALGYYRRRVSLRQSE